LIVGLPTLYQSHSTTSASGATVRHDDEGWHLLLSPSIGPDPATFAPIPNAHYIQISKTKYSHRTARLHSRLSPLRFLGRYLSDSRLSPLRFLGRYLSDSRLSPLQFLGRYRPARVLLLHSTEVSQPSCLDYLCCFLFIM